MTPSETPHQSLDQVNQSLLWRYATKQFDSSQKLSSDAVQCLINSLRLSPSSFGLQPWKFFVISEPSLRQQLREHSWDQPQVVDASHLFVLASARSVSPEFVDQHLENMATTRAIPVENLAPYRERILPFVNALEENGTIEAWCARQTYLALGMLLATAASLKIDACPLEGINPTEYDKLLELEGSNYTTIVACAVGYRSNEDTTASAKKVRASEDDTVVRR
jgi:nitroreductase